MTEGPVRPGGELRADSGMDFLEHLGDIAETDVEGLLTAAKSYGSSWKQRGGVGAFMMMARKWDRLENRVKVLREYPKEVGPPNMSPVVQAYDIFGHIINDKRGEGLIDDIRDLRRYLLLVEAELVARGHYLMQARDNKQAAQDRSNTPDWKPGELRRKCCLTLPDEPHAADCLHGQARA